jgi:uncharacterized membrane protein
MSNDFSIEGDNKVAAVLAYLTLFGLVAALVLHQQNKTSLSSHHISQAIGIMVGGIAISFVSIVPLLGWIVAFFAGLALFGMWLMGLLYAIQGKEQYVPLLGEQFAEWFTI